jgi:N-acetylneuraminic acid mutarotase
MPSTEETLAAMRREIWPLLETAMEGVLTKARGVLDSAEQKRGQERAAVAEERAKDLAEVVGERVKGLAEVDARWSELHREIAAMHTHKGAHEGRVELNVGGYRFETSVQTLRRLPHTFFDAYFSGRYAQDVCRDGSIFVDRDGEHFGHVLEYLRDDYLSVAAPGAQPSVSLLHALKREFDFYCIELYAERLDGPAQSETAFVVGGWDSLNNTMRSMERYDASSGQWSVAASMSTARENFGACVIAGELYVCGGDNDDDNTLSSVEKYSPVSDTWAAVESLPGARFDHAVVAVGSAMYVLGGFMMNASTASTLKFDSVLDTWTEMTPMPHARSGCAACAIGSDIYVFGGHCIEFEGNIPVLKYDTAANTWRTLAPMPSSRRFDNAHILDGLVYIVGAEEGSEEILRYNPASDIWITLAPVLTGKYCGTSFVLGGNLYAAGGEGNTTSVERYSAATDTWTAVANMLEGRLCSCSVTIASPGAAKEEDLFDRLIATANIRTRLEHL